jgi:hypothetical protein
LFHAVHDVLVRVGCACPFVLLQPHHHEVVEFALLLEGEFHGFLIDRASSVGGFG